MRARIGCMFDSVVNSRASEYIRRFDQDYDRNP